MLREQEKVNSKPLVLCIDQSLLTFFSVLESNVSVTSLVSLLQEVYLDPGVWDKLDKLYLQFLHKNPTLPTLAVLLSIL